ncbi:MAG: toxin-antitoxin system HicB family antitoxin [Conexibacter sp.]
MKQLILRVSDDLHRRIAARAAREGKSVNAWANGFLDATVDADVAEDRQARARARLAELGWLVEVDAPPVDEETRRLALEDMRGLGPLVRRELEEGRDRFQ